ncbi:MAG TPA: glycosyltransferase family 39 protein [bacterium]|jgi:4-amino-4-deoxy-L-arabinose transferase-like glycosyltransferase|nr:glycosyltransferase family 39 protein [bacterium]
MSTTSLDQSGSSRLRQAVLLALGFALLRFWLAGRLDLAEDEAYYWEWSRSLALGYYDQGPGLALAIKLGTWLLGPDEQGVRLLSVFSGFAVSALAAWICVAVFGMADMALWVVLAFNGALLFAVGGVMMMHDSLMALGWMGCLACGLLALRRDPRWWLGLGLCAAWALLSKYTAVLLFGCLGLSFLALPGLRRQARTPWPWIGFALACLGGLPMLVWNAQHGWPSFQHVGSLAGGDASRHRGLPWLEYLGSQAGLMTPLLWIICVAAWAWAARRWTRGRGDETERFVLLCSLPPALFFLLLSFHTRVEGNWPACAYLGGILLGARWLRERHRGPGRLGAWAVGLAWGMSALVFAQALHPFLPIPQRFSKADAPARMAGWRELGLRVAKERAAMGAGCFTAVRTYQNAAELAFYQPGQERCVLVSESAPGNEYRFWDDYRAYLGRDAVIVTGQDWEIGAMRPHFSRVEALPDQVLTRNGVEVRRERLWRGYGYKG